MQDTVQAFREYVKKIRQLDETINLLQWDMRTGMPKKGVAARSDLIGMLSSESFAMTVSLEMKQFLETLSQSDTYKELDRVTQVTVRECQKEYDRMQSIPPDMFREYVVLTTTAESVWEDAKEKSDFTMFQPYLEKIVEMNRKMIEIWGYSGVPYNTLLDYYEPGMTVEILDALFADLREKTIAIVQRIQQKGYQPDVSFLEQRYDPQKQRQFSILALRAIGYDLEAGRLDETVHPFCVTMNREDVRVTTRYNPDDFRTAIFGTIHEGGHALYEQNISPELDGTPLATGTSMGIHESQSRFWENIVGRSSEFWECCYEDLQKTFPEELGHVSLARFYRAINHSEPSLVRVEADELTYNLHIMIRYELEKGLINGTLQVADLPDLWKQKMEEYLGVTPPDDSLGVLQDVHWAGGSFGYFPSYSLGNIYSAQFLHAMQKDIPGFYSQIRRGEFGGIRQWLADKVHRHGKTMTPAEILESVTGERINSQYLVNYLEKKYTDVYGL